MLGLVAYGFLFVILAAITVIDYQSMRIPNGLIITGLGTGALYRIGQASYRRDISFICQGIIGTLVGGGVIALIILSSIMIFKKKGMGMGDLKLLAMIGLFTGGKKVLYIFFMAIILSGAYGVFVLVKKKQSIFPFGPFLSLGTLLAVLWGDYLWQTYLNLVSF